MTLKIFTGVMFLISIIYGIYANPTSQAGKKQPNLSNSNSIKLEYDVVIIGGGPAGLSALSSLARVRRTALLIDSGEYRNSPTRSYHDVIGSDGMSPVLFRERARVQIKRYPTVFFQNETVISILRIENNTKFITTVSSGQKFLSHKIILATGIKDIVPKTPGIEEAWGHGMFWCVWCDSWEHRDQPLGIFTKFNHMISSLYQIINMNKDIVIFVNGTDTLNNRVELGKTTPNWQAQLTKLGVRFLNQTIMRIERIQNGSLVKNEKSWEEYDIFRVHLEDGMQIERGAFLVNFPKRQRSYLGAKLGVKLINERINVDPTTMKASPGVWCVGDANNDGTTNVPHALYTGKKAAVYTHTELGQDIISSSLMAKRSEAEIFEAMDNELEKLWNSLI